MDDHEKMLKDSLHGLKEGAELAEEYSVDMQKAVERAIKCASDAKVTAERLRKTADDIEKSRREVLTLNPPSILRTRSKYRGCKSPNQH